MTNQTKIKKSRKSLLIILLTLTAKFAFAQPFNLKSVGQTKTFQLQIHFGTLGKGAFVKYAGHNGTIPLQIKSRTIDSTGRAQGKPDLVTYSWDEVIDGKVTGSYGLTTDTEQPSNSWYFRKKDGKRFLLAPLQKQTEKSNRNNSYLLHGVLLSFNHSHHNQLTIQYPDQTEKTIQLPGFDHPDQMRQSVIADYNFDGNDDIAFSIPDAGMGVYRIFYILLYDQKSKRFVKLQEPNYSKSNCQGLCDVTIDSKNKQLLTTCRGAANWWQDTYRFDGANKLVWIKSNKLEN